MKRMLAAKLQWAVDFLHVSNASRDGPASAVRRPAFRIGVPKTKAFVLLFGIRGKKSPKYSLEP
jgi:hypothetical protein